jgi:hypothetical protein
MPTDAAESGQTRDQKAAGFESSVLSVYQMLTPVVSDGITTENLVMVRTRFLMDWFRQYGEKYPFTLFSYLDGLIRLGKFEIYNEWLFGAAESEVDYESWNQFHEGDIDRFLKWKETHGLTLTASDATMIAESHRKD